MVEDSPLLRVPQMSALVLCPGYHPPHLTEAFARGLGLAPESVLTVPTSELPPYSGPGLCQWLRDRLSPPRDAPPLLLIAFSAGAVGAATASWLWQQQGGRVAASIALDAWGVPNLSSVPFHRLSCNFFTHWSSALLGPGGESFWAEPAVPHLDLWRSPQTACGWWQPRPGWRSRSTAAAFLHHLLARYADC